MSRTKLIIIATAIVATVIIVAVSFSLFSNQKLYGLFYTATEISESQAQEQGYFTIENPDAYILEAINNLGAEVWVNQTETTFLNQVNEHGDLFNIEYEGKYYRIDVIYKDPPL